jgi:hypothetical protein
MQKNTCGFVTLFISVLLSSLAQAQSNASGELSAAMHKLARHINKTSALDADQINQQAKIITSHIEQLGDTAALITQALDLVSLYETTEGPLFINQRTRGGFPRKPAGGLELDRALHPSPSQAVQTGPPGGGLQDRRLLPGGR